jgi:hypothetical protein
MNIIELLTGGKDYISLVKEFIDKIFVHEAKLYHCDREELKIIISPEPEGQMLIMTYHKPDNRVLRIIPDKEVQEMLMK